MADQHPDRGVTAPTKEQCIAAAAREMSDAIRILFTYPVDQAARLALRAGGPSFDVVRARIVERRRAVGILPTSDEQ